MEFYTKYYNQLIDFVVTGVEFEKTSSTALSSLSC
jgi:hypothetical protein